MKKIMIILMLLLTAGTAVFAQTQKNATPQNNGDKGKQEGTAFRMANNKHPDLMKSSKAPDTASQTKSTKDHSSGLPTGKRQH